MQISEVLWKIGNTICADDPFLSILKAEEISTSPDLLVERNYYFYYISAPLHAHYAAKDAREVCGEVGGKIMPEGR